MGWTAKGHILLGAGAAEGLQQELLPGSTVLLCWRKVEQEFFCSEGFFFLGGDEGGSWKEMLQVMGSPWGREGAEQE